jgi:hypothetical protein
MQAIRPADVAKKSRGKTWIRHSRCHAQRGQTVSLSPWALVLLREPAEGEQSRPRAQRPDRQADPTLPFADVEVQ